MKKKNIEITLIACMLMISFCGLASAVIFTSNNEGVDTSEYISDSFWGRLISSLKFYVIQQGTFTIYGDELGCDKYPAQTMKWVNTITPLGRTITLTLEPGDALFINWFRGSPTDGVYSDHPGTSRQFMEEIWLEYGKTPDNKYKITCDAKAYWNYECYVESYYCDPPCYSNSDCSSGQYCEKTIISQKIPNAGVCKVSNPTHKTKVYRCEDGTKEYLGEVSYGDPSNNFCTDPIDSKYLIGSTDSCLPSEPKVCSEGEEFVCNTLQTKCEGTTYYICQDNSWIYQGQKAGKCGCPLVGPCNSIANGTGQIGDPCSNDIDCETKHCDKNHWYSTTSKCQPIPWDELKRVAVPRDEIATMTTSDKMALLCTTDANCVVSKDPEEYKADCVPIATLREEGLIGEDKKEFYDVTNAFFYGGGGGALLGGALGGGICVGGAAIIGFVFPPSIPALVAAGPTVCSYMTIGGGVVGAYEGTKAALAIDEKSDLAKAVKAEDDYAVGMCVESPKGGILELFKFLAFFDVTGDGKKDGMDGMIFAFGIIILLGFMFGGKR